MKLAEAMAYVSSRIILAIVFFLVLTPIGLVKRAMGWDLCNAAQDLAILFGNLIPSANKIRGITRKMY